MFKESNEFFFFLFTLLPPHFINCALFAVTVLLGNWFLRMFTLLKTLAFLVFCFYAFYLYSVKLSLHNQNACVLFEDERIIEQPLRLENLTDRFAKRAEQFLREADKEKKPFFLFFSFAKVHTALFTTRNFRGSSVHGEYGDNVEEMDHYVGRVWQLLEELHSLNDTIVIFTSDHGPSLESGREGGFAGQVENKRGEKHFLKGGKAQNWEGGIRVPTVVFWQELVKPASESFELCSLMDIFPTISNMAGQNPSSVIDGKDLTPVLRGSKSQHSFMFHFCGESVAAVRVNPFKIHFVTPTWDEGTQCCSSRMLCECVGKMTTKHEPPLIFNIEEDPGESSPLQLHSLEYVKVRREAEELMKKKMGELRFAKNNLRALPWPHLFPCCNFPFCECYEEEFPQRTLKTFGTEEKLKDSSKKKT